MMDIGWAMVQAKLGRKVQRQGWNGKGMWISYSPGAPALAAENFWSAAAKEYAAQQHGFAEVLPCLIMKTATGEIQMGWLASQGDLLANDWRLAD